MSSGPEVVAELGRIWASRAQFLYDCDQESLFATPELAVETLATWEPVSVILVLRGSRDVDAQGYVRRTLGIATW
eukprot:5858059-Lingulodinium_polyedra.AAC.1